MADKPSLTMDDIASLAQVSKPTVSRALNNSPLVNARTRDRVLALAREHGYAVNRHAAKLRGKRANTVGVSIDFRSHRGNHIGDPFMFDLLAGVSEALGDRNQDLLMTAPGHNDINALEQMLLSRSVDGLIFLGQGHREHTIRACAAAGMPVVAWGARQRGAGYCVIGSDNFLGGQLAGRHLLNRGGRHFLFVGDSSHIEIAQREAGLRAALEEHRRPTSLRRLTISEFSYETALRALSEHLDAADRPPNAIFAYSDTAAMACIRALLEHGLRVPEDVAVVGYNDIATAELFQPPLTTIRQDTHRAGELLVEALTRAIAGKRPRSRTINTTLIVRDT